MPLLNGGIKGLEAGGVRLSNETPSGLPVLTPPSVMTPTVAGTIATGETVTLSGTFSDGDGTGNASELVLYQYDDAGLTTNKLSLGTFAHDATYDILGTSANKYLQLEYTPVDSRGARGTMVTSIVYGPVAVGAYSSPTDNANLHRWYDFSTDNLTDQSGNSGASVTTAGSGTAPSHTTGVSADGTLGAYEYFDGQTHTATVTGLDRNFSAFIAVKQNTRSGQMDAMWTAENGVGIRGFRFNVNSSGNVNLRLVGSGGSTDFSEVGNRAAPTDWMVFAATVSSVDATYDEFRAWVDSVEIGFTSTSPVANHGVPDTIGIGLTNLFGYIGEVIICNATLTESEALLMSNYLINRWATP